MRIKKISQTTPVQAQIVDGYDESTENGYSCNYINNQKKLLWVNSDPTSSFAAQTITLGTSMEDFDMYEIFYTCGTSSRIASVKGIKGYGTELTTSDNSCVLYNREVNYTSDTQFAFTTAKLLLASGSSASQDNSRLIPVYVIGYKTGLIEE